MYGGISLLKKIDTDKFQGVVNPDWYDEIVRDKEGNIIKFIMNATGNEEIYKCLPTERKKKHSYELTNKASLKELIL